jgi:toxin ParE1/3/4
MAYELTWSPTAKLDLKELCEFIAEDNSFAASHFAQEVFKAIERLKDYPASGRIAPEFADPMIREIIRKPCRIVYRVKEGQHRIEIVRIWYAARGTPEI